MINIDIIGKPNVFAVLIKVSLSIGLDFCIQGTRMLVLRFKYFISYDQERRKTIVATIARTIESAMSTSRALSVRITRRHCARALISC